MPSKIHNNIAIYIHWPFCESKCPYCDFNSHVRESIEEQKWHTAYKNVIDSYAWYLKGKNIASIFFGGGTPTLMPSALVGVIIEQLSLYSNIADDIEITLEANPSSTEANKLQDFRSNGINRVSLGIQSLNQDDLDFLGRKHNVKEALYAIDITRNNFDNYSFDLIYARPNQTVNAWHNELIEAIKYVGPHLSLYQLTIEKGTPFYQAYRHKEFELPDEETSAQLYELTTDIMADNQLFMYEISNYAKFGFESKHNLTYWNYCDYLGIGPGAHSRITKNNNIHALMDIHHPEKWLEAAISQDKFLQKEEILDNQDSSTEAILMGLRLNNGIDKNNFRSRNGISIDNIICKETLNKFIDMEVISNNENNLKITNKGRLLTNSIISQLIS